MLYAVCCLLCRIFPTVPKQDFGSPVLIARCFSCLFFWQLLSRILNQSVVFHRGFLPQKYRCNIISVLEILTFEPQFVMFYWFVSDCWCQSYFSVNRILFSISSFLFFTKGGVKHHKPPWGWVDCLKNPLNCVPKACRSWLFIVVILPSGLFYWVICHPNAVIVGIISKGHGGETMFCLNNDSSWRAGCGLFNRDGQRILTETSGLRCNINCEYNMIYSLWCWNPGEEEDNQEEKSRSK